MTDRTLTRNGRFTWALALALGCTLDQAGGLDLAGRAPRAVPDQLDAQAGPDLYVNQETNTGDVHVQTDGPPELPADAGSEVAELPSSPTGKAFPQCAPRFAVEACGNAGRPDVAFGRTWDGFVCASCAPGVVSPCWTAPPEENGPYGLCRRAWLCVPSCSRDCAVLHGPTCGAVP